MVHTAWSAYKGLKMAMLLVGGCVLVWRASDDVLVSMRETEPTAFQMERFAADYGGQRWLKLTGRLAADYTDIRPARTNGQAYVEVPVVPAGWTSAEPVHAVMTYGPWPIDQCRSRVKAKAGSGTVTITGEARKALGGDDGRFPGVKTASPFVRINPDQEPVAAGVGWFLLVLGVLLVVWPAYSLFRLVVPRRKAADEPIPLD